MEVGGCQALVKHSSSTRAVCIATLKPRSFVRIVALSLSTQDSRQCTQNTKDQSSSEGNYQPIMNREVDFSPII